MGTFVLMGQMPGTRSDEAARIARIAGGDRRAFRKLYHDYHRRLHAFVYRMVDDAEVAEEVVNDALFEVWKKAGEFEARSKVSTWIFGIARYKALNAIRGKKLETTELEEARKIAGERETDAAALAHDRKASIDRALRELSDEHREVVQLAFYEDFSYREIAEVAGCPVNTVKTRMFHAKRRLREIFETLGIEDEER